MKINCQIQFESKFNLKTMQTECKQNMDKHFEIVKIMPSEITSIKHAFEAIFSTAKIY